MELKRDVILELRSIRDVGCRIDSRKGAKVVNKVGLVEVTARKRDLRPVDAGIRSQ